MSNHKYFILPPAHAIMMIIFGLVGCMDIPKPTTKPEDISKIPRKFIDVDGVGQVSYLAMGDERGKRVIFVHGTPGSADGWVDYLMHVPDGYYYIAIDRPGFGQSINQPIIPLALQARAVGSLLGDNDNFVVGHSLGGPIVAKALVLYGQKIQGAVIAAGSLDPGLEKIHIMQPLGLYPPFRWILPKNLDNSNRELMGLKGELEILQGELPQITQKISIIHGTKDNLVPFENVAFMQKNMVNAQIQTMELPGQNHFIVWNSYDSMIQALQRITQSNGS